VLNLTEILSQEPGARPALAGVVSLYQVKDDGQVFLRIRGSNPARVLRVAAEEAEHVRHGESLWLFQHGPGGAPIRVKRAPARDPFTLREKIATGRMRSSDDSETGRTRCRWVEFLAHALVERDLLSLRRPAHHGAGLHCQQLGQADLPTLFAGS